MIRERIPLLLAAHLRKDDAEYQRLFSSAPRRKMCLPNHLLPEQALHVVAQQYIRNQLELVGTHFLALLQMTHDDESATSDWELVTHTTAYVFRINAQAWKMLCEEQGITAADLIQGNDDGLLLPYCQTNMPSPTQEEVLKLFERYGIHAQQLVTVEQTWQQWKLQLQEMSHYFQLQETSL
jgi:crotonobetainyl-CoA:carnitine CoA-transferase CaiB-like acyl-CoA transferase